MHAHALIEDVETIARADPRWAHEAARAAEIVGEASLRHNRGVMADEWRPALTRAERRIAAMDAMGIDMQAVSVAPTQYYYWANRELAARIVAAANQGIAALQHPDLAVAQLETAIQTLGLKGVMVSTEVNGAELADERHLPFWQKAEELGAMIFIHPIGCAIGKRLVPHYFSNVIGNPLETTMALAHLIF